MKNGKVIIAPIVLVFGLFLFSHGVKAQTVSGYTSISYDEATNTVDAYSETVEDYDVQSAYGAYVSLTVTDQNSNLMGWQTASDDGSYGFAAVEIVFSGSPDMTYTAWAIHKAYAQQFDYDYSFWPIVTPCYFDFYDFSSFQGQGISEPWYYPFLGHGPMVVRPTPQIILGGTHDVASVTTPASPEILLIKAKVYEVTGTFDGFKVANVSVKNSQHWADICGPEGPTQPFSITINFQLPTGGQLVDSRCKAIPQDIPLQDYLIQGAVTCTMDDSVKGHMSITARRRFGGFVDNHPGIRFTIGGNKAGQTGTIDTTGTVRILCDP